MYFENISRRLFESVPTFKIGFKPVEQSWPFGGQSDLSLRSCKFLDTEPQQPSESELRKRILDLNNDFS